jgi:cathepsin F
VQQENVDEPTLYSKFQFFINRFNKTYHTVEEYNYRFDNFVKNYRELLKYRNETGLPETVADDDDETLNMDITDFFDLTDEEYEKNYLNNLVPQEEMDIASKPSNSSYITGNETEDDRLRHLAALPPSFDWRERGALTPIRQQLWCGACYAFSAASNVESQYFIKYGRLVELSEQQIMNCNSYGAGCSGGNIYLTFKFLSRYHGLGLRSSTRYIARKEACYMTTPVAKVKDVLTAGTKDEHYIASMLVNRGPLSIAINAHLFKYYRGGIMSYSNAVCNPMALNHAVNIVGYGTSRTGIKYWIVRNTWGPTFGEKGYLRVAWGTCGVNQYVMTSVIE